MASANPGYHWVIRAADSGIEEHPASEPLIVFIHIRKTAGKTLRHIFYRQYRRRQARLVRNYFVAPDDSLEVARSIAASPPPDLRVAHGHMLFWPDLPWPVGTRFCTILRDPVERTISHYFWNRARSPKYQKTLDEAVTDGSIHDNLQTRVLAGTMPPFGEVTEEMLKLAVERLALFDVVGLTERFDESVVLLTHAFGWRRMLYRTANVTPGRPPTKEVAPESRRLIEQHNALDIELYRHARERFEREVAALGDAFELEVAALRRAKELYGSAEAGTPLPPLRSIVGDASRSAGSPHDLRELVVEAEAGVLVRDLEIERLLSEPAAPAAPAAPTEQEEPLTERPPVPEARPAVEREIPFVDRAERTVEEQAEAVAAAVERARRRLEQTERQIRALESGGNGGNEPELERLRRTAAEVEKRLDRFERRRVKIEKALARDAE